MEDDPTDTTSTSTAITQELEGITLEEGKNGSSCSEDCSGEAVKVSEEPPKPEISYPLKVIYCGNCGLPPEYCEYFPIYEKCRLWRASNLPSEELGNLNVEEKGQEEESKGRQKRGGKALVKQKAKNSDKVLPRRNIKIFRAPRGKKKSVTVVSGLLANGIDLKVATKFFGSKFACGSSVTGDDEIVIQGDVKDELFDVIPEKWPEIDEDRIDDDGDHKRTMNQNQ